MTAAGFFSSSALIHPGSVTGQTSTHLPQRVHASAIVCARASKVASKVCIAGSAALGEVLSELGCIMSALGLRESRLLRLYRQSNAAPRRIEAPAAPL